MQRETSNSGSADSKEQKPILKRKHNLIARIIRKQHQVHATKKSKDDFTNKPLTSGPIKLCVRVDPRVIGEKKIAGTPNSSTSSAAGSSLDKDYVASNDSVVIIKNRTVEIVKGKNDQSFSIIPSRNANCEEVPKGKSRRNSSKVESSSKVATVRTRNPPYFRMGDIILVKDHKRSRYAQIKDLELSEDPDSDVPTILITWLIPKCKGPPPEKFHPADYFEGHNEYIPWVMDTVEFITHVSRRYYSDESVPNPEDSDSAEECITISSDELSPCDNINNN